MNQLPETPSRRTFLRQGAAATAGILLVPRFVLGGRGHTAPSDQLLIASVGVGGKGESEATSRPLPRPAKPASPTSATWFNYPGRGVKLRWDNQQVRITNLDEVNRFVKRDYRTGWQLG